MRQPATPCTANVAVLLCGGHRCAALHDRTDTGRAEAATLLEALRHTVRATPHAILIRSDCLGACAQAPTVAVVRPNATPGGSRHGTLVGPVETSSQVRDLLSLIARADSDG